MEFLQIKRLTEVDILFSAEDFLGNFAYRRIRVDGVNYFKIGMFPRYRKDGGKASGMGLVTSMPDFRPISWLALKIFASSSGVSTR